MGHNREVLFCEDIGDDLPIPDAYHTASGGGYRCVERDKRTISEEMKKISIVIGVTILLLVLYCAAGTVLFFLDEPLQNLFNQYSGPYWCGTACHSYVPVVEKVIRFYDAIILSLGGAAIIARYGWRNKRTLFYLAVGCTIYFAVTIGVRIIEWGFNWNFYLKIYTIEKILLLLFFIALIVGVAAIARLCRNGDSQVSGIRQGAQKK